MIVADVYNLKREKVSEVELPEDIFAAVVKPHVLHEVVVSQLAERRSGTAAVKSRSTVHGSTRKLWRQKGTGRARVGDIKSPTRRGGGVAFGPSPRAYVRKVARKVRKAALRMALTDKFQGQQLTIIDAFVLPEIKTKLFVEALRHFESGKALIVTQEKNLNLEKSSRNVPGVKVMRAEGLNVYDVLKFDRLFLEQAVIGRLEEALAV